MTDYRSAIIAKIHDDGFQQLVSELCHCAGLARAEFDNRSLDFLLSTLFHQYREDMVLQNLPGKGVLTTKLAKLPDGVVKEVCHQMARAHGQHFEAFDGRTVLSFLKACHPKLKGRTTQKKTPEDEHRRIRARGW